LRRPGSLSRLQVLYAKRKKLPGEHPIGRKKPADCADDGIAQGG
jgi:hypothetical protein